LQPLNGRFNFRRKVPPELQDVFGKEIKYALNTSDRSVAITRVAIETAKWEIKFAAERAKRFEKTSILQRSVAPVKVRIKSKEQADQLAKTWLIQMDTESAEWWRKKGRHLDKHELNDRIEDNDFYEASLSGDMNNWIAPESRDDGSREVRFYEDENGVKIEAGEYEDYLRNLFKEARLEQLRRSKDRMEITPSEVHKRFFSNAVAFMPMKALTQASTTTLTLAALIQTYLSESTNVKKAPKTLAAMTAHLRFLQELLGAESDIASVTRNEVEKVSTAIERLPSNVSKRYRGMSILEAIAEADAVGDTRRLDANTKRNYFFNCFALFKYAVETKRLDDNPFDDRLFKKQFTPEDDVETVDEVCFTVSELNKIFKAPLYTGCQDADRGYKKIGPNVTKGGRFWVPLIALFHGMRENEACQLHTDDVCHTEETWVFELRRLLADGSVSPDKSFKNKTSRRTIPIHPELVKMGFLDYLKGRQEDESDKRLFPDLAKIKDRTYSHAFSKWWAEFSLHAIGYKSAATFHGFRHGFRDALRRADVSDSRVNKLGGWKEEGQQAKYGRDRILPQLRDEIAKVSFPGLDLSTFTSLKSSVVSCNRLQSTVRRSVVQLLRIRFVRDNRRDCDTFGFSGASSCQTSIP